MNDLWNISLDKTGTMLGLFYPLMIIYATQVGPMVSGSLLLHHSWRWTFWLSAIMMGNLSVAAFLIPETYAPQILRSRAIKEHLPVMKRGDSLGVFLVSIGRPLHMIMVEPVSPSQWLSFHLTTRITSTVQWPGRYVSDTSLYRAFITGLRRYFKVPVPCFLAGRYDSRVL